MLFNSINFFIFFPIVVLVYYIIPHRVRYVWLLAASYYFYISWNAVFSLLMLAGTIISYLGALFISNIPDTNKSKKGILTKKRVAVITILFSVSILFFFKYFYFAVDNINTILKLLSIEIIQPRFDIILPLGISFYTLQIIAYIVDVYKGVVPAERNFLKYALFISFFPKLLAGPIERTTTLLPQLQEEHKFSYKNFTFGLQLMLYGYFLKLVIADRAAIFANFVFDNYEAYLGLEIVIALVIYSIQIYGDFFGYTMIATGAAQVMGFKLMQNFNHPYFANSVTDYWRRWHMSLSTWLRTYIYLPLIFRGPINKLKYYGTILTTFFISGLWHGANWTFIFWGLTHGISIVFADIFKPFFQKIYSIFKVNTTCFSYRLMQIVITFCIIAYSRIFFRAPDIETAFVMTKQMFSVWNPWIFFDNSLYDMGLDRKDFWVLCFSVMALWVVSFMQERGIKIRESLAQQNLIFRLAIYYIAIFYILVFGIYGPEYNTSQFIYFQF